MRVKVKKILVLLVFVCGVLVVPPTKLDAVSENTIRVYNIAGQAVGTLLRGIIQGKVKNFKDALKSLSYDSVAGYGFYESKKLIGKGQITGGVLLANLSASISENVAMGKNPLSYLGYTVGPFRFMIATPFAKKPRAIFNIMTSPRNVAYFIKSLQNSDKTSFRNGLITFEAREYYENAIGWAYGIYPVVLADKPDWVFQHEVIHVVQDLQLMSVSPEPYMFLKPGNNKKTSLLRFGFKLNLLQLVVSEVGHYQSYSNRWDEVEAYFFASATSNR
jgi:hypothetical protein